MWVHDLILRGGTKSEFLLAEEILESNDEEKCHQYFRMQKTQFHYLLQKVEAKIRKKDTFWRMAIPARRRLILTIRYLATGASQLDLSFSFRIGHSTVGKILRETMSALWTELVSDVMPPPTSEKWLQISREFNIQWQCPNCIGAIDGKHVRIKSPPNSGSEFYNYKGYFSIVLLAVCDANYRFILVDIGNSGRHSDGGVMLNSRIGKCFDQSTLNIPPHQIIPGINEPLPLYFAADDAFPLKNGIMKPYSGRELNISQKIFNYRLSRARRVVENTFGILAARWQVFFKMMNCDPKMAVLTVQACVILHNFLQVPHVRNSICGDEAGPDGSLTDGNWRAALPVYVNLFPLNHFGSNNYSQSAGAIRDKLKHFFVTHGAVPWQWNH